jgi:hypothetical protein
MARILGLAVGMMSGITFIAWAIQDRGPLDLAVGLLLSALFLMWCGYMIPRVRMVLVTAGFFMLLSGMFSSYSNWLPQVEGRVSEPDTTGDLVSANMSVEELAVHGERLIFGSVGTLSGSGKAQCPPRLRARGRPRAGSESGGHCDAGGSTGQRSAVSRARFDPNRVV